MELMASLSSALLLLSMQQVSTLVIWYILFACSAAAFHNFLVALLLRSLTTSEFFKRDFFVIGTPGMWEDGIRFVVRLESLQIQSRSIDQPHCAAINTILRIGLTIEPLGIAFSDLNSCSSDSCPWVDLPRNMWECSDVSTNMSVFCCARPSSILHVRVGKGPFRPKCHAPCISA